MNRQPQRNAVIDQLQQFASTINGDPQQMVQQMQGGAQAGPDMGDNDGSQSQDGTYYNANYEDNSNN